MLTHVDTRALHSWLRGVILSYLSGSQTEIFLLLGILIHNVSLLSTSFIEEEHQIWYFLTTTYHLILFGVACLGSTSSNPNNTETTRKQKEPSLSSCGVEHCNSFENRLKQYVTESVSHQVKGDIEKKDSPSRYEADEIANQRSSRGTPLILLILLCCDRILRSWNQTGIKWAHQRDIGDWLVNPENKAILSFLFIISLVAINGKIYLQTKKRFIVYLVFTSGGFGVHVYRAVTGSVNLLPWKNIFLTEKGILAAQSVHFCVIFIALVALFESLNARYLYNQGTTLKKGHLIAEELLLVGYLLLIMLLLRPHNIPLVALTVFQAYIHHEFIWER